MTRKARALISVMYAYMTEYRAELLLWALAGSLPLILMGVWVEAARSGSFPLDAVGFGQYFLAVWLVRQLTAVWVIWEFEYDVVQGDLAQRLLQPIDPMWRYLAGHLSERLARAPFFLPLLLLASQLVPEAAFWPTPRAAALALVATAGAFVLRFFAQYSLAMLCFWTERATAVERLWMLAFLFLAGMLAPLEVFPDSVRAFAELTPFPYIVYFPSALLIGLDVDIARGFAVLTAWTVFFLLLQRGLWRLGLRRFSAMGA